MITIVCTTAGHAGLACGETETVSVKQELSHKEGSQEHDYVE